MDIFKFNGDSPTKLEFGQIIDGFERKLWIERYDRAGEFKLEISASSGIRDILPTGSIISHVDTTEVMIVENHEISGKKGEDHKLLITGRGFETSLEQRITGSNKTYPTNTGTVDYVLPADETWEQLVKLIDDHITPANLIDDTNALLYVDVITDVVGTGEVLERLIRREEVYTSVINLMKVDTLGIKTVRPGPWSPLGAASEFTALVIHKGEDRTSSVVFSYDTGDIENAEYLWSRKKLKNAALVTGKWVETFVTTAAEYYDRRVMYVDATDIDNAYEIAPTGTDLTSVVAAMQIRGTEALASQKEVAITKAELSKESSTSTYRVDYDVGDIVTIVGDYNATSTMRVSEYVEIEDENGSLGYPTFASV